MTRHSSSSLPSSSFVSFSLFPNPHLHITVPTLELSSNLQRIDIWASVHNKFFRSFYNFTHFKFWDTLDPKVCQWHVSIILTGFFPSKIYYCQLLHLPLPFLHPFTTIILIWMFVTPFPVTFQSNPSCLFPSSTIFDIKYKQAQTCYLKIPSLIRDFLYLSTQSQTSETESRVLSGPKIFPSLSGWLVVYKSSGTMWWRKRRVKDEENE